MKKILIILICFFTSFLNGALTKYDSLAQDKITHYIINATNSADTCAYVTHFVDTKFIKEKILAISQLSANSGLTSICSKMKNPSLLLLSSQLLSTTYMFLMNTCDHLSPTLQHLTSQESILSLLKYASDVSKPGVLYGIGESIYSLKPMERRCKAIGNSAVALICLDFICDKCCSTGILDSFATPILTGLSSVHLLEMAKAKSKDSTKITTVSDTVKKPLVLSSIILTGVAAAGIYTYSLVSDPDNNITLTNIVSSIENAILYSAAYSIGTQLLASTFDRLESVKDRCIKFLRLK